MRKRFGVVVLKNGCWQWIGPVYPSGYGYFGDDYVRTLAHRFFYEAAKGAISQLDEIHHLCGNKACVNPEHLEAMPKLEHKLLHGIKIISARTHCVNGHELSGDNVVLEPRGSRFIRRCRACRNGWQRKYYSDKVR